jgi:hypothetical protein
MQLQRVVDPPIFRSKCGGAVETEHLVLDSGESQHVWRDREMPTDE